MARVRKLQEGNKMSNSNSKDKDVKPKINLFETSRGNINYDEFYDHYLRNIDSEIELSGLSGDAANSYREESIKYLDGVKSGNITKLNSDRTFNVTDSTNYTDYRNWKPQLNKANWWEKNMEGKSDSYVIDSDYAKNLAIDNLSKKINQWGIYKEPEAEPKKKSDFLYNYEKANPDLLKETFRGGNWDDKVWSGYDDKTKMNHIANTIQNKINSFDPEERDWNYSNKMGFDNYDSWKSAATNAVNSLKSGILDDNVYTNLQSAGLGGFRQLLDKNYSLNGQNSEQISKEGEKLPGSEIDVIKHGIDYNPFSENYNKIYYKGKEYGSIEEIDTDEDLSDFYNSREYINQLEQKTNYFDFDKGFDTAGDYLLRKDINQLDKINWSDSKKRRKVLDQSSAFSGLTNGNKLYSFKGDKDTPDKHLFFDSSEGKNIEVENIFKKNGVYFTKGKNGKNYLLGNYDNKTYDTSNSSLIGTDQAPIIKNKPIYAKRESGILSSDNDKYFEDINNELSRRFYEFVNYDVSDEDVNTAFNWMSLLDNFEKDKFRINKSSIEGENKNSAMSKVWAPIINKYKLNYDTSGNYTIPIDYLIKQIGKNRTGTTGRDTIQETLFGINLFTRGYKEYPQVNKEQKKSKGVGRSFKQGGIIKFQQGGYTWDGGYNSELYTPRVKSSDYASMNNWDNMSSNEKAIFGATLADIGSMALTFVPGANLAGAGIGAGASLTRYAAGGSDGVGLATDLALDAVSLIPGAKLAKAPKLFKGLGKFVGKYLPPSMLIMSAGQVVGNSDEFKALVDKVNKDGISSLNVNDWKKIATITGALVSGRATFKHSIPEMTKSLKGNNIVSKGILNTVYKNPTIKNNVDITVNGKSFNVPVSKQIGAEFKGLSKKDAGTFTKNVNNNINSEVNKYISEVDGKSIINESAPEWAKEVFKSGKNDSGSWNFDINSNTKVGVIPFKKKEVPTINQEINATDTRRLFATRPKDQKTANQIDYVTEKLTSLIANKSVKNNTFKPSMYPLGQNRLTTIMNDVNESTKNFLKNMKSRIRINKDGGVLILQSGGINKSRLYNNMYYNSNGNLIDGVNANIPLSDPNGNPFQLNTVDVTATAKRPNVKLLNVAPSKALTDIQSGNIKINPNLVLNNKPNVTGSTAINKISQNGNGLLGKINGSSLLNAGNLAVGMYMANESYKAAKKFQPTILTAPTLHARSPQGNEVLNQFYRKTGLDVLNRLDKTKTADQNYNTAALLEGVKYSNEMAEKGALANDQEIKRTTELADRIEQQNIMARNSVANQNVASYTNAINMKNDLKARHIGNIYNSLINPYLTEMRHKYNQKEAMSNQVALEEMNRIPMMEYEDNVSKLNTDLEDNFNAWKTSNPKGTLEEYKLTPMYKDLVTSAEIKKKNYIRGYQSTILNNRKKMINDFTFKSGGKIKYLDHLKEFNKNLERSDDRFRKDIQRSIDRSVKNSIDNTKLAKNIIFKIK